MHHHGRIIFPDLFRVVLFFISYMVSPAMTLAEAAEDTAPNEITGSVSSDEALSRNIVLLLQVVFCL
jgi:hypothetical protein